MNERQMYLGRVKRIAIKVGSGVLVDENQSVNTRLLGELTHEIALLHQAGYEILLISSGAIAFGMLHVGLSVRPTVVSEKQACAAIGQARLIHQYEQLFACESIKVAQVLLSRDDLEDPRRYENARHTFEALLSWRVLPIVNENDSVAIEELKYGDNDNLSAVVAVAMRADLLVILSHVDGVFSEDPTVNPAAIRRPYLQGGELDALSGVTNTALSALNTGGMATKIQAATRCHHAGIATAIINGRGSQNLQKLLAGDDVGTFIDPSPQVA